MLTTATHKTAARKDHSACSGCSLCVPVCPVWRSTRDLRMSPEGRVRALQHGAQLLEIAASVEACTFCGACEPVCPENIDLLGAVRSLRAQQPDSPQREALRARLLAAGARQDSPTRAGTLLVPGEALRADLGLLDRVTRLLQARETDPVGDDISLALETGVDIPAATLQKFLSGLKTARRIIIADGLLLRHLREWLPGANIAALGESLSSLPALRQRLDVGDLYLIDSRAYHADYDRLVMHYHRLREERGVLLNLDLQRIAVPASARSLPQRLGMTPNDDLAHVQWLLKGRRVTRVIAESSEDQAAFARHTKLPVLHVAELATRAAGEG